MKTNLCGNLKLKKTRIYEILIIKKGIISNAAIKIAASKLLRNFSPQSCVILRSEATKNPDHKLTLYYNSNITTIKIAASKLLRNFSSQSFVILRSEATKNPDHKLTLYYNPNITTIKIAASKLLRNFSPQNDIT